jgi:hypothetical protein
MFSASQLEASKSCKCFASTLPDSEPCGPGRQAAARRLKLWLQKVPAARLQVTWNQPRVLASVLDIKLDDNDLSWSGGLTELLWLTVTWHTWTAAERLLSWMGIYTAKAW